MLLMFLYLQDSFSVLRHKHLFHYSVNNEQHVIISKQ